MRRETRFTIPPAAAGTPLVTFLSVRFTYHTAAGWIERVTSGRITVNGATVFPEAILATGDVLAYDTSDIPEPPVDATFGILFDDADLLVLDKSGNLPCHPAGRYFNHTLWALLKMQYGLADPVFVNRLDRETSGLVVVAKTPAAAQGCRAQFAARDVRKRYVVLVEGTFPPAVVARGWLLPDPAGIVRKRRLFVPEGAAPERLPGAEWAETGFRLIAQHGLVAEIEATPTTGRLHQIRATLHALGFPVVGDKLYGVDARLFLKLCRGTLDAADRACLRLDRQALHAAGLQFRHPVSSQSLAFDLPLPADMQGVLRTVNSGAYSGGKGSGPQGSREAIGARQTAD